VIAAAHDPDDPAARLGGRGRRSGLLGQIGGQRFELRAGDRGQRTIEALSQLVQSEPALAGPRSQPCDDGLALVIRSAEGLGSLADSGISEVYQRARRVLSWLTAATW